MTPFEIVYGFNPSSPMDLTPLPPAEAVSLEGETKAEFIKKLHQKARENLEKKTEGYAKQANKGRRQVTFEEGDWVWLHMRPERFPQKRKDKLAPRGDGPFRVIKKINENAYKLELPGEFNVSPTFNVTDLDPFDADDDQVLRAKPSEEGGNDVDISQSKEETGQAKEVVIPHVPSGPLTRLRTRALSHKFCQFVDRLVEQETTLLPAIHPQEELSVHEPWKLLSHQTSASGVFTISIE